MDIGEKNRQLIFLFLSDKRKLEKAVRGSVRKKKSPFSMQIQKGHKKAISKIAYDRFFGTIGQSKNAKEAIASLYHMVCENLYKSKAIASKIKEKSEEALKEIEVEVEKIIAHLFEIIGKKYTLISDLIYMLMNGLFLLYCDRYLNGCG